MNKHYKKIQIIALKLLMLMFALTGHNVFSQCTNYQVYESFGTSLPTSGGTWASTSMTYGNTVGTARTGANYAVFDAVGDILRTPQIANPGVFSFWYKRSGTTTGTPQFTIETSPDSVTWTARGTVTPGASYTQYILDLSALSLTNVYVNIRDTRGSGTAQRYVDDISWTSTTIVNNITIPALSNCSQIITCGTTYSFSDAGTTNDTYNASTDYTITFTPSISTNKVQLAFSSFNTESGYDGMVIYNGPTTASPIISSGLGVGFSATNCPAGSYYGSTSPGTISSSDASGAITIRFRSDSTTNNSGWLASVSCASACITPTVQPTSLVLTQPFNGTISGSFNAASPAPTNYLVVYNTTGTNPSPVNGTTYTIGNIIGVGNIVADIDTNTTFSVSGLNSLTQYYFFVFSYNSACGGGPVYLTASPLTRNSTTPFFYCTANNPTNTAYYISGITTTGGATNFTNNGTGFSTGGYFDYSGTYSVSQVQGSGFSINATHPSSTYGYSVWVDWNNDGDFADAGESVISTGYLSSPASVGTITIPLSTPAGNYRMRIRNAYLSNPPTACGSHDYGETEDYTITVIALSPCTTPTAQPTSLVLTPSNATITGLFTSASPAPTNYLVVYNTTGTTPSLVTGTTYTVGSSVGVGNIVADIDTNTSFSVSGLNSLTQYYFFIFSYNTACGGGPVYLTASPLTGNASTPLSYCTANNQTNSIYYISGITTSGGATNFTNTGTGFSSGGYFDYFGTYSVSQVQGSGFSINATHPSSTYGYSVWVDWNNDGDFADAGESVISTGYLSSPASIGTVTIPISTPAGNYRMRIRNAYLNNPPTACGSHDYGETEDYTITVIALPPCTTPTAQPTVLNITAASTTINGTFTAASPAPSGYLIVRSTSASAPVINNSINYAVGYTGLTPGTTYVVQGSAVVSNGITFTDSGLSANTTYYYYIFSYNYSCSGGPFYLTTTPLTNNATTCIATPSSPVNSAVTTSGFTVSWSASAGALNYVLEVYTNATYTTPALGSPFTIASPTVNYTVTGLNGSTTYYYRIKATTASCSSSYVTGTVATILANDECSGAILLTPATTCSYTTYSNAGATASAGITPPSCANYAGGDVWFSVVVPATGEIDIDTQTGVMTDSGMALYSGTCGSLMLLDCDDDSSTNGLMSYLSRTGLTPGQIIYIRVWEYGNDNNGTFGICVTTPSCPSPSDLYSNILSTTSVTVGWPASTPPAAGGYQYFINTTGIAPSSGTIPTGSTSAGVVSLTLTGLTPGQKYYFWVRSFCGGPDVGTWYGPTNYTPCAVGLGTGTTDLGCTSPIAGGLGLNGNDPTALSCSALTCPTLEVSYLPLKQTTDYAVTTIPYLPPYQFTCLQNPVSVNIDDVWSPTINLPFNFCFYGNNYNNCLIGSNGVITFDTITYAPGGYNDWSFSSNLPNASLFKNTIFGVYQDIDPSKGGQVGYELITLNTGCRALVASWNNIPMFSSSCNSQLYTGMIVLYENTNVIDIYIKEKNICSTWNGGNAIVGVQNSAGTAAVVAPGRNGLDTDWSVANGTGEAWRFTPNGPSINPTVQWYQGSVVPANAIAGATASTVSVCPTVTTTYNAQVTYPLCTGNLVVTDNVLVTVTGNKIWNGFTDTNWNVGTNWTPNGVPTNANCVVVPVVGSGRYPTISAAPDAVGYNLNIYNNATLTINSNNNLTITDKVTVQASGLFTINNSASLIQINNILNSGNIIYKRDSPSVRTLDYVYWSSPVAGFNVSNIVSPYSFGGTYKWNTTVANGNGGWGQWQSATGSIMVAGKGYIARTPGTAPFNNSTTNILNGIFTGVPNNGDITIPIERGPDQNTSPHVGTNGAQITNLSDNWNLLGNPYPSAIRGSQFLFDNNTKIEGNIRLWTHGTLPSILVPSPFYGSYLSNYTPGDYLTYNFTGTSCCPTAASDLFIGAGQGFFVQMVDGTPIAAADNITVAFNNNLRSATYSNSSFYKMQNVTTSSSTFDVNTIERNRIWLDLINPNNQTDRILFGYIENATMGRDSFYDCITQNTGTSLLYSLIDDTKFSIQGRALPFDINDEVPIGLNAPIQGNYTIGLAAVDGFFNNQDIYLKDNLLNVSHNLKLNPYQFSTQTGEINDRFKIIYIDNALGSTDNSFENDIKVIVNNEIIVSSSNLQMESIVVYNVLGQELATYKNVNTNYFTLSNIHKNNTTLLLKIKLETGETVIKKIVY